VRIRRPFSVTLLALGVLSIAGLSLVRFITALRQWDFLAALPGVSPLYLTVTGLIWTAVWLPLAVGLWFGKAWSRTATLFASGIYAVYWWADRVFAANVSLSYDSGSAWQFPSAATVILLALVFWTLTRAKAKAFFRSSE
jgi:hypothetical protein